MTFTKEQMERLSKWERNFSAVVYGKFLRAVGQTSLGEIVDIYAEATGVRLKARGGCATCIYETLSVVGIAYFDDKAEMEAEAVEEQEAAAMPAADESALVIDKYYLEKKTGTRHSSLAAAKKSAARDEWRTGVGRCGGRDQRDRVQLRGADNDRQGCGRET